MVRTRTNRATAYKANCTMYMYTLKVRDQCSVHENCTVYRRFLHMYSSSSDTKMAQCLKPFLRHIVTTAVIFYIAE